MQYPRIEEKNDQHLWNLFFSLLFALLLALSIQYLYRQGILPLRAIPPFDFVLIALAIFRVTRLLVYDRITKFLRDMFLRSRVIKDEQGRPVVERTPYNNGPLRTIHDLLDCPWCVGVWVALAIVFSYFVFPFAWFIIAVLALAGLGSFIQVFSSLVGWGAEGLKLEALAKGTPQKDR